MGLGKILKKAAKIAVAPAKNLGQSAKSLASGDVKGALKYGTRAALAPISQPAQIIRNAPGVGGVMSRLPGANKIDSGLDRIFGNPMAAPRPVAPNPAQAALQAFGAGSPPPVPMPIVQPAPQPMPEAMPFGGGPPMEVPPPAPAPQPMPGAMPFGQDPRYRRNRGNRNSPGMW